MNRMWAWLHSRNRLPQWLSGKRICLQYRETTGDAGSALGLEALGWEDPLKEAMATHSNREAWWATVHRVAKSRTWLSDWTELKGTSLSACFLLTLVQTLCCYLCPCSPFPWEIPWKARTVNFHFEFSLSIFGCHTKLRTLHKAGFYLNIYFPWWLRG